MITYHQQRNLIVRIYYSFCRLLSALSIYMFIDIITYIDVSVTTR
jgi:hypothetical protein